MTASPPAASGTRPTRVRYGVLGFCCLLSMITYLDRVCFGTVAPFVQGEFSLSDRQLGMLFSAFALAYAVFEVPTGWLGDFYGARRTLIRIVLWWSAFTALTGLVYPLSYGSWAFFALLSVRFLFGVGEAGAFPNISRAFASWFPATERGFAQGTVWMAGRFAGGVSPLLVLALVYTTVDANGGKVTHWRHIFWIFGGIGVAWCFSFWAWFRDSPIEHPGTNEAERQLILGSAVPSPVQVDPTWGERFGERPGEQPTISEGLAGIQEGRAGVHEGVPPTSRGLTGAVDDDAVTSHAGVPWGKLATDGNLWLLCLMYFCAAYGWYFNITWLPKYLGERYGVTRDSYDIWQFSLLAGAPLLLGSLACLFGGLLTDRFIRQTGNRKWGRRLFGIVGHSTCALCYFLSLTADSPWVFVTFVALAAFCNDLTMGAAWASCIDIGGKYAGIVSGCMNTIGNLGGAVAGFATGYALDHFKNTADPGMGWTINFISYGIVYLIAVLLWLRFDATKQVAQSA